MEPPLATPFREAIGHDDAVHEWRVWQLSRLGIPWSLAQAVADHVDWHQVARLVQRGCPPRLALDIVPLMGRATGPASGHQAGSGLEGTTRSHDSPCCATIARGAAQQAEGMS
jgi:hypothetical protein